MHVVILWCVLGLDFKQLQGQVRGAQLEQAEIAELLPELDPAPPKPPVVVPPGQPVEVVIPPSPCIKHFGEDTSTYWFTVDGVVYTNA